MGDFERPQSRLAFVNSRNTDLKVDLEKLSLLNDGDTNKINNLLIHNDNNNVEGAYGPVESLDEKVRFFLEIYVEQKNDKGECISSFVLRLFLI